MGLIWADVSEESLYTICITIVFVPGTLVKRRSVFNEAKVSLLYSEISILMNLVWDGNRLREIKKEIVFITNLQKELFILVVFGVCVCVCVCVKFK